MQISPFQTEQYFAKYEFTTPYLLCASDCESMTVNELLELAGQSLSDLGNLTLGYTETQGHPELRTLIAQTYLHSRPEHIVIVTPEEGIFLTIHTLIEDNDHVIVLSPAYDSLRNLAQYRSRQVSLWPVQATAQGWTIDIEELNQLIRPHTKLIIVNFPHNPTGLVPDLETFQALINWARQHNLWIFCDEMYRGLELNGQPTLPSLGDMYEQSIILSGLSKVHGLPGLRSGWLVIQDDKIRAELINWKHYTTICAPTLSEYLATLALRVQAKLQQRNRQIIETNLSAASDFFKRWPELFYWRPPQAGSVALVGLQQPSALDYCHHLVREAGVMLLPGSCIGADDKHIRMGFGRRNFIANLNHYEHYLYQNEC